MVFYIFPSRLGHILSSELQEYMNFNSNSEGRNMDTKYIISLLSSKCVSLSWGLIGIV